MILSILIPSIPERSHLLNKLVHNLHEQRNKLAQEHPTVGGIQILVDDSKKFLEGGKSVGQKRNDLVQQATGDYLCFLDDDDEIPFNYVETLVRAMAHGADIITFNSLFKCDTYWSLIDMSLRNNNEEATPNGVTYRNAWHICPMRSELAKKHQFSNINNAEDWDWMQRVLGGIFTEYKLNMILHQYNHFANVSAVDEIERA